MTENELATLVVQSAIEVHRTLGGPGLLETVYEEALAFELESRGLRVQRQKLAAHEAIDHERSQRELWYRRRVLQGVRRPTHVQRKHGRGGTTVAPGVRVVHGHHRIQGRESCSASAFRSRSSAASRSHPC